MRSNRVVDVLTSVETTYREVAALPLEKLSRTDVYALLERLDKLERQRAALDRKLMGRLLVEGGPSVRDVARRLRVSPGEMQRRLSEAVRQ